MLVSAQAVLCVVVVVFFVVVMIWLDKRDQRRKEQQATDDRDYQADLHGKPRHVKHPTDEEHRTAEQAYWRWSIESENRKDGIGKTTLYFSIVATLFAGLAFWQTWRQANVADETYVATARAWMDVSVDPASVKVHWFGYDNANVVADVTVLNHGNSPATGTRPFMRLFSDAQGSSKGFPITNVCERDLGGGTLIFPQVPVSSSIGDAIHIPDSKLFKIDPKHMGLPPLTYLEFAVCVTCKILGDPKFHYTGHLFIIDRYLGSGQIHALEAGVDLSGKALALMEKAESDTAH